MFKINFFLLKLTILSTKIDYYSHPHWEHDHSRVMGLVGIDIHPGYQEKESLTLIPRNQIHIK